MDGGIGDDGLTKLGVAAALSREYEADEKAFMGFLAQSLERILGPDVELAYSGGFLAKKTLRSVTLSCGEDRFTLEDPGHGPLKAKMVHFVRGIALKTVEMKVDEWLAAVSEIIELRASEHAAARRALEGMLGLS
ncbi:MAG: hypothetical protein P4L46_13890 [Fimbriimonas sp.]|nr:hypothetical protein [Fimbriimonas sp.]